MFSTAGKESTFINRLFASGWTEIIRAGLLAVTIAAVSSAGTCFYMLRDRKAEATEEISIKEVLTEEVSMETRAFSVIVENLKQQAHEAIFTPGYTERGTAIEEVGEGLKEILTSEYASLLDNDTFHDDEFSVIITEYPLRERRSIQRIKYTIKANENDIIQEESRHFLWYIGEASFFSDIEYSNFNERRFQVFENYSGCFAFLISSGYEHKTYSSYAEFSNYSAKIFIPGDIGFSVEQTEIPLGVTSNQNLRLVQQDETIKAIIPDAQNEPEAVFNSSSFAFEMPKGAWESEAIDFDLPGLLLGLSDSEGNIRTLFIRKEGERIRADEYAGQIIFPRKNELFSLKHYIRKEEFYGDEFGNDTDYRTGSVDIKKLLCAPLGGDKMEDFDKAYEKQMWNFCGSTDIPLYVGEDYICYIQQTYYSGGGSFRESSTDIRFDKLDDLFKFSFSYRMIPDFQEIALADLIYGRKADDLYQTDNRTYGGEINPYIDFKQLSIKRNLGKWSLMLPVMQEYYHPGNGSFSNWIKDFAAYSNDLPTFLASNRESMEMSGTWSYWDAKDLIKVPESDAFLAQYDYVIGVGNRENVDYFRESINLEIPVNLDEYIVSISFADADTQEIWLSRMSEVR